MQKKEIKRTVDLFKIFSDETRLSIIALLVENEHCVQDICKLLNRSQSSISHQLRLLRDLNVVKTRRDGKNIFYALKDLHVRELYNIGFSHANEC